MPKLKSARIKIEISARHVHLNEKSLEKLFGRGQQLKLMHPLSQENEFAAKETVVMKMADKLIKKIRVLGPLRRYTQVEISKTDAVYLGLNPPARMSGDLKGTPGAYLIGSKGKLRLKRGVILARRHIHCSPAQAAKYNLKHKQLVKVKIGGERGLVFDKVMIKVKEGYDWHMHLDTDEANAAGINQRNRWGTVIF